MKIKRADFLLAVLSGVLTALSFPKFGLSFLAWISLVPLLFLISKHTPKRSFGLGFLAGISFYAILIYWIPSVPVHYGNLSYAMSFLIYIAFVLFLSLFWAVFCLVFSKIFQSFPRMAFILSPFLWVAFEYILTHLLTGFPWGLLGSSQYRNLPFIQTAAFAGVYGLSFVMILFISMFVLSMRWKRRSPFFVALGLVLLLHLVGLLSIEKIHPGEDSFKASVLQGNVPSDIYWSQVSYQEVQSLFQKHVDLSRKAYNDGAQLIIWPEFTAPMCFSCPEPLYQDFKQRLFQFVQETGCTLLLGSNETLRVEGNTLYHNTALCLSPDLSISQYYKMHLVPFGEYTPYKSFFGWIETMTHAIGDITPGEEHVLHRYEGFPFGSPICYEIIFPDLVRKFSKKGAQFLVTITNDGWYGKSSAPYQHFSMAVLRAVENRRFLLRAATTGVSGIIDPYGRVLSQSEMMTEAYLTEVISPYHGRTLYTRYGDYLPIFCLTISSLFLILAVTKRKHERKKIHHG